MLHPVKQNVRNPVIPHRPSFSVAWKFIGPFDSLWISAPFFRDWHHKCSSLPQRKTPGIIQPGVQMEGMR